MNGSGLLNGIVVFRGGIKLKEKGVGERDRERKENGAFLLSLGCYSGVANLYLPEHLYDDRISA